MLLQSSVDNVSPSYKKFTKLDWIYDSLIITIHSIDGTSIRFRHYSFLSNTFNAVLTDYIVTYEWYRNDEIIYFSISIIILSLVMLITSTAFATSFVDPHSSSCCKLLIVLFMFIPISPLFSILCWMDHIGLTSKIHSFLRLKSYQSHSPNRDNYKFAHLYYFAWLTDKFESHSGFIFSLLIQCFPQCLLQTIYIVAQRQPSMLNILSIIASVLSVINNSTMFCYARDVKVFILNILCISVDIFGIFAVISWSFDDDRSFYYLSHIWKYKVLFITLPSAIWFTIYILFNRESRIEALRRLYVSVSHCYCLSPILC